MMTDEKNGTNLNAKRDTAAPHLTKTHGHRAPQTPDRHFPLLQASASSADPLGGLKRHNKTQQKGKPVKAIPLPHREDFLPQTVAVRDSDSDCSAEEVPVSEAQGPDPAEDLVVFRIPHKHPHMLKRPLQHLDEVSGLDFAARLYCASSSKSDGNTVTWQ